MKTSLILEGGGMRGLFTSGVLDVFMENGVTLDMTVGVSAGAAFGCNYKSKQAGRAYRYNLNYCRDPRYASLRSLILTGDYYGADFCYRTLPEELDLFDTKTFRENPMPFYVTCTDIENGRAVFKRCAKGDGDDLLWMRASASMPLVSRIVEVDGRKLLDGGIADSIPLDFSLKMGYTRHVIVLTQPADYRKKKNPMMPLLRARYRAYPALLRALERRHIVYNRTLDRIRQLQEAGEVFVIQPERALPLSRTEKDPKKLRATYAEGLRIAVAKLPALRAFLEG